MQQLKLTIGKTQDRVDEKIYGQFIEHILTCINGGIFDPSSPFADSSGMRTDVVEKLSKLRPSVLRFPGGTIMCQYHWMDAVGPAEKRIRRKNLIWGGELDPSFGTAEFVQLCKKLGAEPMICINMASGTPEEAAAWVEYCNGTGDTHYAALRRSHGYEETFNVKYWCIGNECYAEPDIGIHHDVSLYVRDAMEYIKWMKLTDRSIKTVVVCCDDEKWNRAVLDRLHPVTDYISYHHYSGEGGKGLYGPFYGEKQLRQSVDTLSSLIEEYPEKVTDFNPWYRFPPRSGKIQIALDEWNIWDFVNDETYGLLQKYNWRDALWTASVMNMLISHSAIAIANLAQAVNVLAPVIAEKEGSWFQTIAYPFLLYRQEMTGKRVEVNCNAPIFDGGAAGMLEALSVSAIEADDGLLKIAVVNRDFEKEYQLLLPQISGGRYTRLAAEGPWEVCSISQCCVRKTTGQFSGQEISLPAGSMTLLFIENKKL